MEEQLEEIKKSLDLIKEKVEAIDEKTNNKWVLPVLIVVLTAILGGINYYVEKNIDKNLVQEMRKKEVLADLIADERKNFYSNAKINLLKLDELFEEYCSFLDKNSEDKIDDSLQKFMFFYNSQQFIEKAIIEKLKSYSEYISEEIYIIGEQSLGRDEVNRIYETSKDYLKQALSQIEIGLKKLEE